MSSSSFPTSRQTVADDEDDDGTLKKASLSSSAKMDPLLRDDFQLYIRVGLLLSISVYTAIKVNSVVTDPYLVCHYAARILRSPPLKI
ncbi:hypothetical protein ABW20_dc0109800 [Dactylellina cionopaga]|nr:hypothetical protein ABW20_dc0109800 [Dactylellina cionopaga]